MKLNNIQHNLRKLMYKTALVMGGQHEFQPYISVYCYHSFSHDDWDFSVSLDALKRHLEILLLEADPITESELLEVIERKSQVSKNRFMISIDDGYKNVLDSYETFNAYSIKPLLFVLGNPDSVDRSIVNTDLELLSESEIKALSTTWDIGSHGMTHALLTAVDTNKQNKEIIQSKRIIESIIGRAVRSFSYPKGKYNQGTIESVGNAGYLLGFSMDDKVISTKTNRYAIPRVGVSNYHTLSEFKALSLPESVRLRGILRKYRGEMYA